MPVEYKSKLGNKTPPSRIFGVHDKERKIKVTGFSTGSRDAFHPLLGGEESLVYDWDLSANLDGSTLIGTVTVCHEEYKRLIERLVAWAHFSLHLNDVTDYAKHGPDGEEGWVKIQHWEINDDT